MWLFCPLPNPKFRDASFLLTVEIFLLTVHLFYLRWGNRKQKRPNPITGQGDRKQKRPNLISGQGGTVSKKDQTDFHRKQRRPNRISTVSKKDQAN